MSDTLLVLSCGGTFDKSKFTRSGKFVCGDPAALDIFKRASVTDIQVRSVTKKDSLDMDDADRAFLVKEIQEAKQEKIVIVHGTDTLVQSAQAIQKEAPSKTVVLVGAFQPAIFKGSDAEFNLGFALGCARTKPKGVWVAMHANCFSADEVSKNIEKMRFEKSS